MRTVQTDGSFFIPYITIHIYKQNVKLRSSGGLLMADFAHVGGMAVNRLTHLLSAAEQIISDQ